MRHMVFDECQVMEPVLPDTIKEQILKGTLHISCKVYTPKEATSHRACKALEEYTPRLLARTTRSSGKPSCDCFQTFE
jgi:hypothetical protein